MMLPLQRPSSLRHRRRRRGSSSVHVHAHESRRGSLENLAPHKGHDGGNESRRCRAASTPPISSSKFFHHHHHGSPNALHSSHQDAFHLTRRSSLSAICLSPSPNSISSVSVLLTLPSPSPLPLSLQLPLPSPPPLVFEKQNPSSPQLNTEILPQVNDQINNLEFFIDSQTKASFEFLSQASQVGTFDFLPSDLLTAALIVLNNIPVNMGPHQYFHLPLRLVCNAKYSKTARELPNRFKTQRLVLILWHGLNNNETETINLALSLLSSVYAPILGRLKTDEDVLLALKITMRRFVSNQQITIKCFQILKLVSGFISLDVEWAGLQISVLFEEIWHVLEAQEGNLSVLNEALRVALEFLPKWTSYLRDLKLDLILGYLFRVLSLMKKETCITKFKLDFLSKSLVVTFQLVEKLVDKAQEEGLSLQIRFDAIGLLSNIICVTVDLFHCENDVMVHLASFCTTCVNELSLSTIDAFEWNTNPEKYLSLKNLLDALTFADSQQMEELPLFLDIANKVLDDLEGNIPFQVIKSLVCRASQKMIFLQEKLCGAFNLNDVKATLDVALTLCSALRHIQDNLEVEKVLLELRVISVLVWTASLEVDLEQALDLAWEIANLSSRHPNLMALFLQAGWVGVAWKLVHFFRSLSCKYECFEDGSTFASEVMFSLVKGAC